MDQRWEIKIIFRQFNFVEGELQQGAVVFGIAHQDRTQQVFLIGANHNLLVDFFGFIDITIG